MNNDTRTFHSDCTDILPYINTFERYIDFEDVTGFCRISIALCCLHCLYCVEKCTYFFAIIKDDLRSAKKVT